jgi:hypothetical protein
VYKATTTASVPHGPTNSERVFRQPIEIERHVRARMKRPANACLARGVKWLEARPASDTRYKNVGYGTIYDTVDLEGGWTRSIVQVQTVFPTKRAMWAYYDSLGVADALIPSEWLHAVGATVNSASTASSFLNSLYRKNWSKSEAEADDAVRVMELVVVEASPDLYEAYDQMSENLRAFRATPQVVAAVTQPAMPVGVEVGGLAPKFTNGPHAGEYLMLAATGRQALGVQLPDVDFDGVVHTYNGLVDLNLVRGSDEWRAIATLSSAGARPIGEAFQNAALSLALCRSRSAMTCLRRCRCPHWCPEHDGALAAHDVEPYQDRIMDGPYKGDRPESLKHLRTGELVPDAYGYAQLTNGMDKLPRWFSKPSRALISLVRQASRKGMPLKSRNEGIIDFAQTMLARSLNRNRTCSNESIIDFAQTMLARSLNRSRVLQARVATLRSSGANKLMQAVFGAWKGLQAQQWRAAAVALMHEHDGVLNVLVRRSTETGTPQQWVLPGCDDVPRQRAGVLECLAHVIDLSSTRSDQVVSRMRSKLSSCVTRRSFNKEATVLAVQMKGRPLASKSDEFGWMRADDVARGCKLSEPMSLALSDALRAYGRDPHADTDAYVQLHRTRAQMQLGRNEAKALYHVRSLTDLDTRIGKRRAVLQKHWMMPGPNLTALREAVTKSLLYGMQDKYEVVLSHAASREADFFEEPGRTTDESSHLFPPVAVHPVAAGDTMVHSSHRSASPALTASAVEEVVRVSLVQASDASLPEGTCREVDAAYMERIVAGSRRRAYARGSTRVTPRDVAAEAEFAARPPREPKASPAAVLPEHYDEITKVLADLAALILSHREAGMPQPRVLIIGERHGVIASLMTMAGADVATCDLSETTTPHIPHFKGDGKWIRDLGWDLVINHPPCVYLSNAGLTWLHREPGRYGLMVEAAAQYRHMRSASAPFVITENPKMHGPAKRLTGRTDAQYVHPWQHGTGHTKPTGLEVTTREDALKYAFPPLQPTCVVPGREHAMANLPEKPERADQRGQTYVGIGAAMVIQWLPRVVEYLKDTRNGELRVSASALVSEAQSAELVETAKVGFCTMRNGVPWVLSHEHKERGLDTMGGKREPEDSTIGRTAVREPTEEMDLPSSWLKALRQSVETEPLGHAAHSLKHPKKPQLHHIHVWGVYLTFRQALLSPTPTQQGESEGIAKGTVKWRPLSVVVAAIRERGLAGYADAMDEAVKQAIASKEDSVASVDFQPWKQPRAERKEWTPLVNRLRFKRGWQSWQMVKPEDENVENMKPVGSTSDQPKGVKSRQRSYAWVPLPNELNEALSQHLRRPQTAGREPLPDVQELGTKGSSEVIEVEEGEVKLLPPQVLLPKLTGKELERDSALKQKTKQAYQRLREFLMEPSRVAVCNRQGYQQMSWERLRAMWDVKPQKRDEYLGLGLANHIGSPGALPDLDKTLPSRDHRWKQRDWVQQSFVNSFVKERPDTAVRHDTVAMTDDDIAKPMRPNAKYHQNCLYIRGVSVCRRNRKSLKKSASDFHFSIDVALAVLKVLADSGAGPSVITTELLAMLPYDACVSREHDSEEHATYGPDGKPLRTHGHAVITFQVNQIAYKHRFLVVEGAPLMLLGNDFLDSYMAKMEFLGDGTGAGRLTLSRDVDGTGETSTVEVTCNPVVALTSQTVASVSALPPLAQDETGSGSAADATHGTGSTSIRVEPLPGLEKPVLTSADLLKEHLEIGQSEHLLFSHEALIIPARSRVTAWLKAPLPFQGKHASYLVEHLPIRPGLDLDVPAVECRVVTPDRDHHIPVTFWNTSKKVMHIPGYSPVAQVCVEHEVLVQGAPTDEDMTYDRLSEAQQKLVDTIPVDPDNQLTVAQKLKVRDMLAKYIAVFALDPKQPGNTHVMEVELPLKPGSVPHRHAPSRSGEAGSEIIEKHVADMESRGIIRKSNSPWASRIVLVKKKGGEIRFCIDYRDTNSKLMYLDSPIPLTIEALDKLSSGNGDRSTLFLSTLDLASGFWCLPIKESDKEVTAFSTRRGKYEFNVLPFGIQSGPSYMCRLMDAVLQGLAWEICMPYLDDVGIWSTGQGDTHDARIEDSFEQMLHRLDLVFGRLAGAGLTCRADKCILFATETPYLGHIVSREGLKMDPKKIEKVMNIEATGINTLERVRAFLGLCSYYRRFVKNFSTIAQPLTDLTQKGCDVPTLSQEPKCQAAIEALKDAITSEPVLAAPRFDRIFKVGTDGALTEGLGGVLKQDDDYGHERVIAYYGRRLNKHERNYTVTEIELLAALESIRNWRPYLWGRHFKLIIDHAALKWLHTMRDTIEGGPASRLMRWILKLAEYDFEVEHKAGAIHSDADGLSRLVAMMESWRRTEWNSESTGIKNNSELADLCKPTVAVVGADEPPKKNIKKIRKNRRQVVTARRVQRMARDQRNHGVSRPAILEAYLSAGGLMAPIAKAQAEDPECSQLRTFLEEGTLPPVNDSESLKKVRWLARESRTLTMKEWNGMTGVMMHVRPDGQGPPTAYVPESLRLPLLSAFHDHLGHQGAQRTLTLLRTRYYWPGMQRDVDSYVKECHECTMAKPPPRRDRASRAPTIGSYPFDLLYCDVVDMAPTWDYDSKTKSGFSKLIVFVDSLSHWVEAIPMHGDPSSEDVLDAFMTHVVARHGVPRGIASDLGSNIASELCQTIYKQTGVDLTFSPSDHHEAAGRVERHIQTLVRMARTSDEGGKHWVDHLPFLLLAYRATPTRVTQMSPAEMLYGRELRLPAQMSDTFTSATETVKDAAQIDKLPVHVRQYAEKLNTRLRWAWEAARDLVHRSQVDNEMNTTRKSQVQHFEVDDRVCRLLPRPANKLEYIYSGPYRVAEVISDGRYKLTDLENRMLSDVFDTSQLRPYRAKVDAEELQNDEYIVDELMKHRGSGANREYQVKWRGYPRAQGTWVPRHELMRRCDELVIDYENEHEPIRAAAAARSTHRPNVAIGVQNAPPVARQPNEYESDDVPSIARFARGRWEYGRYVATPRGRTMRWFQPSTYTKETLDSTHFTQLRNASQAGQATVNAIIEWETGQTIREVVSQPTYSTTSNLI